jgi:G3E family GTPase
VLIETSGLALPKPLVQAFQWPEIKNVFTVDAVVTVVDGPAAASGQFAEDPMPSTRSAVPTRTWTTSRRCTSCSKTSSRPPTWWCSTRPT